MEPKNTLSDHPSRPPGFSSSNPWLYPLAAGFLLAALFGLRLVNDADMGFHLASGKWIVTQHRLPTGGDLTYTAQGRPYLDMEWLYQVFLYLGFLLGGYSLLALVHMGLGLAAFRILWTRLRLTSAPSWMAVLVFIVAVLACEPRFRVRPEVLTWVLLGLELWVLELRWARERDLLFLLPVLQVVWVNTEGLFFIGPAVAGIYLLAGLVHFKKTDPKLVKMAASALGLCLLNPHLLRGLLFPFSFISDLGSSAIFKYTVQEFNPPWAYHTPTHAPVPFFLGVYKLFSLGLFLLLLVTSRKRKLQDWLLSLFFFALSASAVRNIPLFLLTCAPIAATSWKDWEWGGLRKYQQALLAGPRAAFLAAFLVLGYSARVATNAHYVHDRMTDRFGLGLDESSQPERAYRFLLENKLNGRIVNDLDGGDWLDWRGPSKSFIDGRLDVMGSAFFTEYMQSQGPGGAASLIEKYQPDLFLFNPLIVPRWLIELRQMPGWRLVYLDSTSVVFLRKGFGDQVPDLDLGKLLAENGVSPALAQNVSALLLAPPPSPWGAFMEGFFLPSDYPNQLLSLGTACGYGELIKESELFFLEGISRTRGKYYDFFYNLGLLYEYSGRHSEAVLCMRRALSGEPNDPLARRILGL